MDHPTLAMILMPAATVFLVTLAAWMALSLT